MEPAVISLYFDYKSPFAYLAKDEAYKLEDEYRVRIDWLPYILNIPEALGDLQTRTEQQWRKIRYSYMDVRRWANKKGLVIRGPQKIFDSSIAAIGALYAQKQGTFRAYHDRVYECFWRRELDIEDQHAIVTVLGEVGGSPDGFLRYLDEEGPRELAAIQQRADKDEVFGVPLFIVAGEMFWGHDRVPLVREKLETMGLKK
ncbi:MAG: disulfide bond formation protein DsbA [Deltaproteobacteria bacterium]|nr:disulfide bond formation protein DsbA [Deltaproteobacteria bacterium]